MERVFLDTDILLDVLAQRQPHYPFSAELLSRGDKGEIKLGASSVSFANINYLLSKHYNKEEARNILKQLKTIVEVCALDDKVLDLALSSDFKDFEDVIQYYSALENNYKLILTRNLKDYKTANIPVMTAESYVKQ